jgi:phage tail-like protein
MSTADIAKPTPLALEHTFYVMVGAQILGAFMEVSGLGVSYHMYEYEEGGNNAFVHRLPGRMSQQNLTLKTGLTSQPLLLDWALRRGRFCVPQIVTVTFTDELGPEDSGSSSPTFTSFSFNNAVPVRWTGPSANIAANAVATESLEIAHEGML